MCGALAISAPPASNRAQEKSSRSLMLTEVAVDCSATPISSAMAMNRLLKISSRTGSTSVPMAWARSQRHGAGQDQRAVVGPLGAPAGLDDDGRGGVEDQGRAGYPPRLRGGAAEAAGGPPSVAARLPPPHRFAAGRSWRSPRPSACRGSARPRRHSRSACGAAPRRPRASASAAPSSTLDRRVAAGRAQPGAAFEPDLLRFEALVDQVACAPPPPARAGPPKNPRRAASASSPRGSPSPRRGRCRRRTARRPAGGSGSAPCPARRRRGRHAGRRRRRSRRACSGSRHGRARSRSCGSPRPYCRPRCARNPSAISSRLLAPPSASATSCKPRRARRPDRAAGRRPGRTPPGNCSGSIRPRNRLQSVTVSGPPAR